jgi:hypothetical protein
VAEAKQLIGAPGTAAYAATGEATVCTKVAQLGSNDSPDNPRDRREGKEEMAAGSLYRHGAHAGTWY